jgi:hypothetical protein
LTIELSPELERRLGEAASRSGENVAEHARRVLEAHALGVEDRIPEGPQDIEELARRQGVKPVTDPDQLLGDFWPEDETCDDFIAALREWRREGVEPPR